MLKKTVFIIVLLRSAGQDAQCVPGGGRFEEKRKGEIRTTGSRAEKDERIREALPRRSTRRPTGMIRLHKVKGKLYFEFPVALLSRHLLGSAVSEISDSGDAVIGSNRPIRCGYSSPARATRCRSAKPVRDNVTDAAS